MPQLDYSYDLKRAKNKLARARLKLEEAEHKQHWRVSMSRMKEQFAIQCARIEEEGRKAETEVPALQSAVAALAIKVDRLDELIIIDRQLKSRAR